MYQRSVFRQRCAPVRVSGPANRRRLKYWQAMHGADSMDSAMPGSRFLRAYSESISARSSIATRPRDAAG
ncbi:hypothetical protein FQZ97_529400 [compost metagenome]